LVKLAYQETLLKAKIAPKQWKTPVHQSHLVSNEEGIQLTTCLDMPQDNSFTLLLIFLHLLWDTNLSTHHFGYDCLEYGSKSITHFKWPWMHKLTQLQWIAIGLCNVLWNQNWERIMNIDSIHQPYIHESYTSSRNKRTIFSLLVSAKYSNRPHKWICHNHDANGQD